VVKDTAGNPLQGVTITVTTDAREDFSMTKSTNKKGKFIIVHLDVALTYTYTFEKEGYQTFTHEVRPLDVYDSLEFVMLTLEQAGQVTDQPISGRARAVKTYNEGVVAKQGGDLDGAEKLFREAVEIDPELVEGYVALASVAHERGDFATAATQAERALELDPDNLLALQLRFDAYRQLGDEGKAAEAAGAMRAAGAGFGVVAPEFEGLRERPPIVHAFVEEREFAQCCGRKTADACRVFVVAYRAIDFARVIPCEFGRVNQHFEAAIWSGISEHLDFALAEVERAAPIFHRLEQLL